jgi:hypothetical protein
MSVGGVGVAGVEGRSGEAVGGHVHGFPGCGEIMVGVYRSRWQRMQALPWSFEWALQGRLRVLMGRLACMLNVPSVGTLPAQNVTAWHDAKVLATGPFLERFWGDRGPFFEFSGLYMAQWLICLLCRLSVCVQGRSPIRP